jgi:hypothetical protein
MMMSRNHSLGLSPTWADCRDDRAGHWARSGQHPQGTRGEPRPERAHRSGWDRGCESRPGTRLLVRLRDVIVYAIRSLT